MAEQILLTTVRAHTTLMESRRRVDGRWREAERGSSTAQTAMILLLVTAAIAAGSVIAGKMTANANNVPSP